MVGGLPMDRFRVYPYFQGYRSNAHLPSLKRAKQSLNRHKADEQTNSGETYLMYGNMLSMEADP
ncbi:predicted protein [Coccidioides posadasii str. Silveira]|uniref:Predicted protein n=1 Tax=Coccidioides posadasii (strain RMSCC 757 / Silveira) TaxID=443226 RepID=E9D3N4_COCPS|nr:predicted protein [Coccidioides posadasii str. Silveira]